MQNAKNNQLPEAKNPPPDHILATVLENTPMLAAYLDTRFNLIWVNFAYAKAGRQSPAYFVGRNHFDLYPSEENQAIFQHVVDTGVPFFAASKPFVYPDQPGRGTSWWDWSLVPARDEAGKTTGLVLTLKEVTDQVSTRRALRQSEANLEAQNELLAAIGEAQALFISGRDQSQVYARMLDILVHATGSEYGFLDEVACDPDGHPIKRSLSISEISWDADSGRLYQDLKAQRFEFHSLDNLAGAPVIEKRIIIANDAPNDPRAKGLPKGHPALMRYMGIPLYFRDEIIGVVGVANRPDDYTEEIAAFIQPLTRACSAMIQAGRMARREAEALAALKASEKRYRSMAETANEGIWAVDADFRTTYVNQRMADMLGCTPPEILGRSVEDFFFAEDLDDHRAMVAARQKRQGDYSYERRFRRKDGSILWTLISATPLYNERREHTGSFAMFTDITERKRTEDFLRMMVEMLDDAPNSITIHDTQGQFLYANRKTFELHGCSAEAFMAINLRDLDVPESGARIAERLREIEETGQACFEVGHFRQDGSVIPLEVTAKKVNWNGKPAVLSIATDIADRRRAEAERDKLQAQLLQAQKMESVGRLAGGVAHDFNNMLGVILGYTELALEQVAPGQPMFENLREIHQAAQRSADLTRQLLAFARRQTASPKVLDLNDTVEGMLQMLRRLIGEDIDLRWLPGAKIWPVKIDPSQVDQILANLCLNARDAIGGAGRMEIQTGTSVFDAAYCEAHPDFSPGEYVALTVRDDGSGMDAETIELLFEPFFTTKGIGHGTGLGLPTVYGIVKQNNGFIHVESQPGRGATFCIYLPRHKTAPAEQQAAQDRSDPAAGGSETILLVEDEPAILSVGQMMLEKLGYRVLAADRPEEALRLARTHEGTIDLLITDVVMPGMNGSDLAAQLHALHPDLRVLFMSGYTADVIARQGVLEDGACFVQKPFSLQELAAGVREVLK